MPTCEYVEKVTGDIWVHAFSKRQFSSTCKDWFLRNLPVISIHTEINKRKKERKKERNALKRFAHKKKITNSGMRTRELIQGQTVSKVMLYPNIF